MFSFILSAEPVWKKYYFPFSHFEIINSSTILFSEVFYAFFY